MSVQVIAPIRCPHCRSRLTSRTWLAMLGPHVRWCAKCRCTVAYAPEDDGWQVLGSLTDDGFKDVS